jgi:hypothetical protein
MSDVPKTSQKVPVSGNEQTHLISNLFETMELTICEEDGARKSISKDPFTYSSEKLSNATKENVDGAGRFVISF